MQTLLQKRPYRIEQDAYFTILTTRKTRRIVNCELDSGDTLSGVRQSCIMLEQNENHSTPDPSQLAADRAKWLQRFVRFCALAALFYLSSLLTTCSRQMNIWEQIQTTGKLRVVTRDNPATFFEVDSEEQGFEYDLIQAFANELGVEAEIYTAPVNEILTDLKNGRAHLAAAGLTVTPARAHTVNFGPVYQTVEQVVVGRRIRGLPKTKLELPDFNIGVLAGSSHVDSLVNVKQSFPSLAWQEEDAADIMSLLRKVKSKQLDLTIVDSNEYAVMQRYFPELAQAFTISEPQELAWAVNKNSPRLLESVNNFFTDKENSGELDKLKEEHFGFVQAFDFVELVSFIEHSKTRLPEYEHLFKLAARTYDIDWRFLAAIAYQESHWRPDAVSPTGVKGMMMLTKRAAEDMGISNREDVGQSIAGGTRYFLRMHDKMPKRIQEPDRTWLALAGYNVGFLHLEDARILTQRAGKNPDLWRDVQEFLPLLEQKKYYSTVKRGKARGSEPVKYVNNIRDYYDLLKWSQRTESTQSPEPTVIESESVSEESDEDDSGRSLLREIFNPIERFR